MKKYKNLVPIALVALMGIGVYSTISEAANIDAEYEKYLKKARKDVKLEVIEEAVDYYGKALELKDTPELCIEVGNVYADNGWDSEAVEWGEKLIDKYPDEPKVYEFLLKQYIDSEQYKECFSLRKQAEARKVENKKFKSLMSKIEYMYTFGYDEYTDVSVYSGGLCAVKSEDLWGYANLRGETEISAQFSWAGPFSTEGVAPIKNEKGEFYYISETGNKKIALQNLKKCTALGVSINGILPAADNEVYAYYDEDFKKISGDYSYASAINGEVGAVKEKDSWKLVDSKGKALTKDTFESVVIDDKGIAYRNERAFVQKDDKYFMVNNAGKKVGKQDYEDARLFLEADGYAAVKKDGKWGFIDKDGKVIIEPQYAEAHSFSNGYAAVKKDGKWGFIDKSGKLVIEAEFSDVRDFNEQGNCFVQIENQWKLLKLLRNNYA